MACETTLKFDPTESVTPEGGVVLGHLEGPCADFICPTRNGRGYSESLWDRVFKDPITQEYFDCGGIFGELGHPTDRDETDMSKIALCMPKPPEKKDGKLWATFDILDTPNGRILKTLCKYGYKMGISSRGSGDLVTDYDGNESVDPDTYQFNAFDAVLLPAVKEARLAFSESVTRNKKSLNQALTESYHAASDEDQKIMMETFKTLENLNLDEEVLDEMANTMCRVKLRDLSTGKDINFGGRSAAAAFAYLAKHPELTPENCQIVWQRWGVHDGVLYDETAIDFDPAEVRAKYNESYLIKAVDESIRSVLEGTEEEFKALSEAILSNIKEQINVESATDEADDIGTLADDLQEALMTNSKLEKEIAILRERLSVCSTKEKGLTEQINAKSVKVQESVELSKKNSALTARIQALSEQLDSYKAENVKLQAGTIELRSELTGARTFSKDVELLRESVAELKKDKDLQKSAYDKKLVEAKALIMKSRKATADAVDRYIELQAKQLGVTSNEIKSKLCEGYSFKDIDMACESLRQYQLNIGQLPFNTSLKENMRIKTMTTKKDSILPTTPDIGDSIDPELLKLAGLN